MCIIQQNTPCEVALVCRSSPCRRHGKKLRTRQEVRQSLNGRLWMPTVDCQLWTANCGLPTEKLPGDPKEDFIHPVFLGGQHVFEDRVGFCGEALQFVDRFTELL